MQIHIDDHLKKLSKTQRTKLKEGIRGVYSNPEITDENRKASLDTVFNSVHFPEGVDPYGSMLTRKYKEDEIHVSFTESKASKEKSERDELRQRLRDAIGRGSRDPLWIMYRKLKPHVQVPLPTPTEISQNTEMFSGLIHRMKPNDPIGIYFKKCLAEI